MTSWDADHSIRSHRQAAEPNTTEISVGETKIQPKVPPLLQSGQAWLHPPPKLPKQVSVIATVLAPRYTTLSVT
jgi:hypothetical protein